MRSQVDSGTLTEPDLSFGSFARLLAEKGLAHEKECLTDYRRQDKSIRFESMLAHDALGFAGLPDRDVEVALDYLHRRGSDQLGAVTVVERLPSDVEAGLVKQRLRVSLMQSLILDIVDEAPQLRIAVYDLGVDGGRVQAETWITGKVLELRGARHAGDP